MLYKLKVWRCVDHSWMRDTQRTEGGTHVPSKKVRFSRHYTYKIALNVRQRFCPTFKGMCMRQFYNANEKVVLTLEYYVRIGTKCCLCGHRIVCAQSTDPLDASLPDLRS